MFSSRLFQLTAVCIKMNRPEIGERAVEIVERRLAIEKWPEYHDTKHARFIGEQLCLYQTWFIAGFLVTKLLIAKPEATRILWNEEDVEIIHAF